MRTLLFIVVFVVMIFDFVIKCIRSLKKNNNLKIMNNSNRLEHVHPFINQLHVNITNNGRWGLKILFNNNSHQQWSNNNYSSTYPTFLIQTTPSSARNRPQTVIEVKLNEHNNPRSIIHEHNNIHYQQSNDIVSLQNGQVAIGSNYFLINHSNISRSSSPTIVINQQEIMTNAISNLQCEQILTADVIAQTLNYSDVKSHYHQSCPICLQDFCQTDILLQLVCKHLFHRECLLPWLCNNYRCPYCRFLIYIPPSSTNQITHVPPLAESSLLPQIFLIRHRTS
ncbi:unnamed protein product [Didymodactylos carnosus]|uniref:RING-type domain-containing protein n=1 Tax=Didymodactylos carnosus TaxID=1234261 RepID=A0A815UKT0_9BILA|nr:unnamed protein product [Didymodactylos carnosus]CAF1515238.1 unnamed protein product [Didymodactylos carnosus]CAF3796161.1 unnamed protein product [Didymodactylos carnosus]CAF4375261.1 unnamed protein product [Didymodactylos carnosus]